MSAAPIWRRTPRCCRIWRSACCGRTRTTARCAGRNTARWSSARASPRCSPRIRPSRCPRRVAPRAGRDRQRPDRRRRPARTARRRSPCADEFAQAAAAIANGRDAIDRFNAALLSVARGAWPDRWTELDPRPVILSSWVGYDTDGRTDIGWWDTLRLRLEMKRRQLVAAARAGRRAAGDRRARRRASPRRSTRSASSSICVRTRPNRRRSPRFAHALVGRRDDGADLAGAAAAAVRRRRSPPRPTTTRGRRCASRAPGWCRMGWRSPTRICG